MWYYPLLIILIILSLIVSFSVNSRFKKYSREIASSRLTGAQVAERILRANGIYDVSIRQISGNLTDNYNPLTKTLSLSSAVYNKSSISSICVAAHEVGHAIQHAQSYAPLMIRKTIVPAANISSMASYALILLGIFFQATNLIMIGAVLFSVIVLFNFITLPVEFDASRRALIAVRNGGYLTDAELKKGRKVLSAAAMTYFLALLSSILQLLRLLSIARRN